MENPKHAFELTKAELPRRHAAINGLPPELIALIIKYFSDDKDALRRCALIGPAWVTPCRLHLFRSVQLGPRHFGEDRESTFGIFAAIPSLQWSVVSLTINSGKPRGKDSFPPRLAIDPEFFVALLLKMPRLHTIILERCAVEPKADMASTLLPHCWDHPRLRLLRITPSYQASYIIDIFRTAVFFRRVHIDVLELRRQYDATGYSRSMQERYVAERQYEILRGWRVKTVYPNDSLWKGYPASSVPVRELRTLFTGLVDAGVTDTLQLNHWGISFLSLFWNGPRRLAVKHLKLEIIGRSYWVQPDNWSLYARCADVQSVTLVFNTQALLERFSRVLLDIALPSLPRSIRAIGFEIHLDSTCYAAPHVLLTWWDSKMQWVQLAQALEHFTTLGTVHFGVITSEDVGRQLSADLNHEMEAIVRKRMPGMFAKGIFQFHKGH
ncbi:uncharacterized protein PHACADRAFT_192511 [Phanerochaete carnosa HHB-10118-sp]|uniref:F-box domain-containing protein n=1 Tax=Phanerochaete carnosa (strain HHB-10118-sp) TaxID=650164 RepID=K5XAZ0_PHACS|nr:uncharacterized protein PHACADRAFT_192511 [Phanerochaete carnosa HHB-10118-sp]EKM60107.1 hypothetical protein PHACADRAFT_192511 [Phanerochaete carnosa HHB-10118-sp]